MATTVEAIKAKHDAGETLTAWERSVYRVNFRPNGERYSSDAKVRDRQMAEDIKAEQGRTR